MTDHDSMHVLAARFADPEEAAAVERELRSVLDVADTDIQRHTLGGESGEGANATVLGGRFRSERLGLVEDVIRHHGGEVVADTPETWTQPRRVANDG